MVINDKAYESLGKSTHILLYYDKKEQKVGLKGCSSDQYAFPLRRGGGGTAWSASVKSFLIYHNIDRQQTRRFRLDKDRESGLLVMDLKEPIATMKARSRGGRTPGKTGVAPAEPSG